MCDNNQLNDPVNHPSHYLKAAITIEPIELTSRLDSCLGQALQYVLRAPFKGNEKEDLQKAIFYLKREQDLVRNDEVSTVIPLTKPVGVYLSMFYFHSTDLARDVLSTLFVSVGDSRFEFASETVGLTIAIINRRITELKQQSTMTSSKE